MIILNRPRWQIWTLSIALTVLTLGLFLQLLLQDIYQIQMRQMLQIQSPKMSFSIGQIGMRFFPLRMQLSDVRWIPSADQIWVMQNVELLLNWKALMRRKMQIRKVVIREVRHASSELWEWGSQLQSQLWLSDLQAKLLQLMKHPLLRKFWPYGWLFIKKWPIHVGRHEVIVDSLNFFRSDIESRVPLVTAQALGVWHKEIWTARFMIPLDEEQFENFWGQLEFQDFPASKIRDFISLPESFDFSAGHMHLQLRLNSQKKDLLAHFRIQLKNVKIDEKAHATSARYVRSFFERSSGVMNLKFSISGGVNQRWNRWTEDFNEQVLRHFKQQLGIPSSQLDPVSSQI